MRIATLVKRPLSRRFLHVFLSLSAMGINQSISPLARPPLTTSGRSCGRNSDRGAGTNRSISINPPLSSTSLREGREARKLFPPRLSKRHEFMRRERREFRVPELSQNHDSAAKNDLISATRILLLQ